RALRLHRVLDGLDEDVLSSFEDVLDALPPAPPLELGTDDLVDVQEPVPLEAELDEGGLHARQHVVDAAEVDVARDRPPFRPLEVDLRDLVVLEHRDALLADVDRDEQLALRLRKRCAPRRLAPASLAALLPLPALLESPLLRLRPDGLRLRLLRAGRLVGFAS